MSPWGYVEKHVRTFEGSGTLFEAGANSQMSHFTNPQTPRPTKNTLN